MRNDSENKNMNSQDTLDFINNVDLVTKVLWAKERIIEFYEKNDGKVFISFSGGKDSTVLLHLVRSIYPNVPGVFFNTGVEFPETVEFVKTIPKVLTFRPKKNFKQIIDEYGFPYPSKPIAGALYQAQNTKSKKAFKNALKNIPNKYKPLLLGDIKFSDKCCHYLKMEMSDRIKKVTGRVPYVGVRAAEGRIRFTTYVTHGCNIPSRSWPLALFSDSDMDDYIAQHNIELSPVYYMGYKRTGCIYCLFGCDLEEEPRFKMLKKTHPKLWLYAMDKLGYRELLNKLGVEYD